MPPAAKNPEPRIQKMQPPHAPDEKNVRLDIIPELRVLLSIRGSGFMVMPGASCPHGASNLATGGISCPMSTLRAARTSGSLRILRAFRGNAVPS